MRRTVLLSFVVAATVCASSSAATRQVPSQYPTIQTAINACSNGDTVIVAPGTYNERIDYSGKNIVVSSTAPDDPAVVAATIINAGRSGSAVTFMNGETQNAVLTGFTVTGGYGTNYLQDGLFWGGGVFCSESSPTITKNVIANNNGPASGGFNAISYGGGIGCLLSDAVITNNIIKDNTGAAGGGVIIYIGNARITDNLIYGNSGVIGGGVVLLGGQLINNTVVGNDASLPSDLEPMDGRPGGNVYAASDRDSGMFISIIVNNIICGAPSGAGIYSEDVLEDEIAFNDVWGNLPGNYMAYDPISSELHYDGPVDRTGTYGNISADPLFVHPDNDDYHLLPDSPCIGAGDPAFIPEPGQTDIDGDPRIYAIIVDIGADEYVGYVRPVADAGDDVHLAEPGSVTLDGSSSFFYDPCSPRFYSWQQVSGAQVTLSDPNTVNPTFTPDEFGEYRFELVVSDGQYESWPDQVIVLVGNEPPVADAGVGKVIDVPGRGTLDGSGSYDPDPIDVLSYSWTQVDGPAVVLQGADTATPYFDCNDEGLYVFQLIVSDGMADSEPSTVQVATVSATVNQEYLDAVSGIDGYSHYPDVSGDKVVCAFGWGEDYDWDIACRDFKTGQVVTFSGGGIDTFPKIDGDIVVWCGGPDYGEFGWPRRNTSVFMRELSTGAQRTLRARTDSASYSHPAVSGNKVVWIAHTGIDVEDDLYWRQMPYAICGADITDFNNPVYFTIAYHVGIRDPYPIDDPSAAFDDVIDISGNIVVWEGGGDIYGADISDLQHIRYFTAHYGPGRQYDPAVSGRYVVWTDERDDSGDIYGADLSDLSHIRQTTIAKAAGSQLQPDIDGCVVVYVQGSNYGGEIRALCLTKQHGPLDIELLDYPYGVGPAINDGILVWQTSTYGYLQAMSLEVGYSISDGPVENKTASTRYDYIQHAINGAADGDRIVAEEGIYGERVDLRGKSLTISSANPGDPAVVAATVIKAAGSAVTFANNEDVNCTLAGFTVQGSDRGVYCYCASPTIADCIITGCTGPGIELFKASKPKIANCNITDNSGSGVQMWLFIGTRVTSYNAPVIADCVIARNSRYGLFGDDPKINNCTIVDNSAGGVNSRVPVLANSIVYYNGLDAAQIVSSSATVTYSNVEGSWPGAGNVDYEPAFVDWEDGNFHLLSDSPCINAGNPEFQAESNETDIDGEARLMLGRVDMGADEFNPFEVEFVVVGKERVGRTIFEYECRAILTNISNFAVHDVQLKLAAACDNVRMIQPNVTFGDVELGEEDSAVSIDTCTIQVDRSDAIDSAKIIWHSSCQIVDTCESPRLMACGLTSLPQADSPADLVVDGRIDYADLAELAGRWLGVGQGKGVPPDIAPNGIVDFADFAELAKEWKK
ncbi:MAG: right-handed parallel beta-helix repeat-containing protein [Sedimentisphaerales bacterium]|nr:right-handed parallel beta-helix repeat-containing protein [Sedimentisphaerales bacterium]